MLLLWLFEGEGTVEVTGSLGVGSRVCSGSTFEKGVSTSGRRKSRASLS